MVPEILSITERIFLSFWAIFCPFTLLKTKKIKTLKNWKSTWRYYHFTHVYHKWHSYDVWFLRYGARKTIFLVILDHFLPFYPPNNPKIKILNKSKKKTLEILSFYTCTITDNHTMYGSWNMEHGEQNFLSFWTNFCPFTPPHPKNPKIKILKKLKKTLEISSFYTNVLKIIIICYTVWQILYPFNFRQKIFFVILDHYLPFYLANNPKNQNLKKFEKSLEISSFYTDVP